MTYRVIISEFAKEDIKEAVLYYKNKASSKIAVGFLEDYEQSLIKIKQNPFFQVYYKNF